MTGDRGGNQTTELRPWYVRGLGLTGTFALVIGVVLAVSGVVFAGPSAWSLGALAGTAMITAGLSWRIWHLLHHSESGRQMLEDQALSLLREKRNLEYQQDRVRRIVDNAADAYIEISQVGEIQGWNTKASELFGVDASAGGAHISTVLSRQTVDFLDLFWGDPKRFDGVHHQATARHPAGHDFPIEATVWVDESDMAPKMSMFIRDITLRREAEVRLERALQEERNAVMRLQEIDKAKTDFVSSISHELRSPLTNTLGYLEVLSDGDAGELSDRQRRMVEVAERNARRLLSSIEDLLTLSHIESGQFGIKYKPVEVADAVRHAVGKHAQLASEREIAMELTLAPGLGICPGDQTQIVRALAAIVGNAVKFTPPAGRVDVTVNSAGEFALIQIEDNGIGIPEKELPHLFDRFYRTSVSVDQQHQGAGLGLTIARAIIEHHGGEIEIHSVETSGTKVNVRLPMLPLPRSSDVPVEPSATGTQSAVIDSEQAS